MVLSCQQLKKSFVGEEVVRDASFTVEDREKVALVGLNGAGKTTLLKLIVGELFPDSGCAVLGRDRTLGYLAQYQGLSGDKTIYETVLEARAQILESEEKLRRMEREMKTAGGEELSALMEAYARESAYFEREGGYALRSEVAGVLKGLGFSAEEFDKAVGTLSGGQATRVALGRLLLTKPDLVLLDEPTNHLDMASVAWLEGYLSSYPGAVLIVSHDRYFLNRVVTKVVEIERGVTTSYSGTYDAFAEKKAEARRMAQKAWLKQQAEIKHQEAVIEKLRSFNREKSIRRAESREKQLGKIERLDKPQELKADMTLTLEPETVSGNDVLQLRGLAKSFGPLRLFADADLHLRRGERVGLIGENGTGKSTILKIVDGVLAPDAGEVIRGAGVQIGYYDQETHVLHDEKTLFEELQDEHPQMDNTRVRSLLAAFLFTGDDVFKRIGDLSGGERGRVSLCKLMLSRANFLLLDEPTNHLDIASKEILEEALRNYTGTVLFVSHDRYFLNRVATRIVELSDGGLTEYIGNYDDYLEQKARIEAAGAGANGKGAGAGANAAAGKGAGAGTAGMAAGHTGAGTGGNGAAAGKGTGNGAAAGTGTGSAPGTAAGNAAAAEGSRLSWEEQKREQARIRKLKNDLEKTEAEITEKEEKLQALQEEMGRPEVCRDAARLIALQKESEETQEALEALYDRWTELSEEET